MTLEEMSKVDPRTVDRSSLVQCADVHVGEGMPKMERVAEYMRQMGNPYCYLDGKILVKLSFAENGRTIEDCVRGYLGGV